MGNQKIALSKAEESAIADLVYDNLLGCMDTTERLPWVEPVFLPGHPCFENYRRMEETYSRILKYLGKNYEEDLMVMVVSMMEYSRDIAVEMFHYGSAYRKMKNKRMV